MPPRSFTNASWLKLRTATDGWLTLRHAEPHPRITRRFIPAYKENKREAGCTKELPQAQETKETPCYEKVHSGEEVKGGGAVKIEH